MTRAEALEYAELYQLWSGYTVKVQFLLTRPLNLSESTLRK